MRKIIGLLSAFLVSAALAACSGPTNSPDMAQFHATPYDLPVGG